MNTMDSELSGVLFEVGGETLACSEDVRWRAEGEDSVERVLEEEENE